eukprot:508445_1
MLPLSFPHNLYPIQPRSFHFNLCPIQARFHILLSQCEILHSNHEYNGSKLLINECKTIFKHEYDAIQNNKELCHLFCVICSNYHEFRQPQNFIKAVKYDIKSIQYIYDPSERLYMIHDSIDSLAEVGCYDIMITMCDRLDLKKIICNYQIPIRTIFSIFDCYCLMDDETGMKRWLDAVYYTLRYLDIACNIPNGHSFHVNFYYENKIKYIFCQMMHKSESYAQSALKAIKKAQLFISEGRCKPLNYYLDFIRGKPNNVPSITIEDYSAQQQILMIKYATMQHDFFKANQIYTCLCDLYPDNTYYLYQFGLFCRKMKHFMLAKKAFSRVKKIDQGKQFCAAISEIDEMLETKNCDNCSAEKIKLRVCTGCGNAYYCNKKCQKQGWRKFHKTKCDLKWKFCWDTLKDLF